MNNKIHLEELIKASCTETRAKRLNELIEKLEPRFSKAPASSEVKKHQAFDGGLIVHIIDMFERAVKALPSVDYQPTVQEVLTACVLHDLCKVGDSQGNEYYVPNILKRGRSEAKPYKIDNDNRLKLNPTSITEQAPILKPYLNEFEYLINNFVECEHGEMSLALVYSLHRELHDSLTPGEKEAIIWHDGGFNKKKGKMPAKLYPLSILIHAVDMLSARCHFGNVQAEDDQT